MKVSKILVPMVALSATLNNPSYQVQATDMVCIEGCVAIQAVGSKACSQAWVNPFVYSGCMALVSTAFATCCFNCARSG